MFRYPAADPATRPDRQRGSAAVELALLLPILMSLLLGIIDFGLTYGQYVSLQGAAREAARQGITQGDVITASGNARGILEAAKLETKYMVDVTDGAPGVMVVCLRYPKTSLTGFFDWALNGSFETKAIMRMEGTATTLAGVSTNWGGGLCTK